MKSFIAFILLIPSSYTAFSQCGESRYKEKIFDDISVFKNILYGSNVNNLDQQEDLYMDLYMPSLTTDTLVKRPVIFFLHGGSYVEGTKEDGTIRKMCREFASRGYVSISVEYRIQNTTDSNVSPILQFADKSNWYKSILRSVQDIRGSIRYIKYDVAENNNPYHIDTNNITLYGSSAGAIGILHATYLDQSDTLNNFWTESVKSLGGLEGTTSTHLEYGSVNTVRNLVVCSGAIGNVYWIGDNNNIDVIGFHHNFDPSVPYNHGCFYTAACHLGRFDGMKIYAPYLSSIGARIEQHVVEGIGHPVDELLPDLVLEKTVNFLYASQCKYDTTIFTVPTSIKYNTISSVKIYPNPAKDNFRISIPQGNQSNLIVQIFSMNGGKLFQDQFGKNQTTYDLNISLPSGMYIVKLSDGLNISTQKLMIQ
jgi:hypothetical protein